MDSTPLAPGLSAFAGRYRGIVCDVWGVLHNGIEAYAAAGVALSRWRAETGTPVVLLTNAPRPAARVAEMLERLGLPTTAYDAIVTSGDVTRELLAGYVATRVLLIGPARDLSLIEGLPLRLVAEEEAEIVLCTGLFDDETETAETYRPLLERLVARGLTLVCANPDIVVERGDRLIYCAGAIAQLHAELGGRTVLVGKPHKPVYDVALARLSELAGAELGPADVLAIGDALPTDVRGAWGQGMDVLFVTDGIHSADFGDADAPDMAKVTKRLAIEGLSAVAAIPRLAW
jgi:HAD superfamily hydrolase (TIGR01459 family)